MLKFYICPICGNLIEMIEDSGANPVCCGQDMEELIPETTDGSKEKHIPVYFEATTKENPTKDNPTMDNPTNTCSNIRHITVKVGEAPHPMIQAHSIRWITILTDQAVYRINLTPSHPAEAHFFFHKDEKIIAVYAYCNLHGLWISTK